MKGFIVVIRILLTIGLIVLVGFGYRWALILSLVLITIGIELNSFLTQLHFKKHNKQFWYKEQP